MRRRRRVGCFGVFLIFFLIALFSVAIILFDSNTRLVTTEYILEFPHLPPAFDGYRIALLADNHGAEHGEGNEKLIQAVRESNSDIIVIVGDIVDRYQPGLPIERQLEITEELIDGLVPIAPVYFVTGNHEWDLGPGHLQALFSLLEDRGVRLLRNSFERLEIGGDTIILAGVEDPNGPADMITPADFLGNIHQNEAPEFLIVLYHRNYKIEMFSRLGVDLLLSGHAHGGLVRLPFTDGLIGPRMELFPTYTSGLYTSGGTQMIVTRGLGNHLGWTRFLNNPELVIVELRVGQ
ncbi:MAG: metallophosphoesterase [Oscillospiraceae bacterium]|nr:metallophosphoesterase [Oscillospiraceae bacterium]MCL2278164.1 metallophosphoesterase [Oscillospiraceae bacterium]